MQSLLEQTIISDTIQMGAEFSEESQEIALYFATPEMSASLALEKHEWEAFLQKLQSIDDKNIF